MTRRPNMSAVAAVIVTVGLRIITERKEDTSVDGGVLPSIDRGTSGGGILDRRPSGFLPVESSDEVPMEVAEDTASTPIVRTPLGGVGLELVTSLFASAFTVGVHNLGQFGSEVFIRLAWIVAALAATLALVFAWTMPNFRRYASLTGATLFSGLTFWATALSALSVYTAWFTGGQRTSSWGPFVWLFNAVAFGLFTRQLGKLRSRALSEDLNAASAQFALSLVSAPREDKAVMEKLDALADQQHALSQEVAELLRRHSQPAWHGPRIVGGALRVLGWMR